MLLIESEIEKRLEVIEDIKKSTNHIWTENEDWILRDEIEDGLDSVVLALAKAFPECLREAQLVLKTKGVKSTIGDWLRGEKRDVGHYFRRCSEGGWQLTPEGIDFAESDSVQHVLSKGANQLEL